MTAGKIRRIDWSPDEWIAGVDGVLTDHEAAIYFRALMAIYSRGDRCPNDAEYLASRFKLKGSTSQARSAATMHTRRALDRLIELGKLHVSTDGQWLTNGRADAELNKARERIGGAVRAGIASGAARRARTTQHRPSRVPSTDPAGSKTHNSNGLARTSVRNHQPPILTDQRKSTDPARASRSPVEQLPARAPEEGVKAVGTALSALAKQHREKQIGQPKPKSAAQIATEQRLAELARKHREGTA